VCVAGRAQPADLGAISRQARPHPTDLRLHERGPVCGLFEEGAV